MNAINIFAAIALGCLVIFTALGMYVSSCRTAFLHTDSEMNKTILAKFRTHEDLTHFCNDHEAKIASEADETLQRFARAFTDEVQQTRMGRNHPIPKARFSDFN